MKAPLSANMRCTSPRLAPGSGRNSGSRYSSCPEKYQSKRCMPPCRPSGSALPSSGPATNPSRDMDMSMTTFVMAVLLVSPLVVLSGRSRTRHARGSARSSAHRFLHERAELLLLGGRQLLQRERDRPQGALVEFRRVAEAERRVPRLELVRALEEADDLAVLRVGGHAVPRPRLEGGSGRGNDLVDPLGHGTVLRRHLGDPVEEFAQHVRPLRGRLLLLEVGLHRGALLGRQSRGLPAGRGGALAGLRRRLLCGHRSLLGQRSSWMRIRLPAGSRTAQSRTPYGWSEGSWTTSTSPACTHSNVP